MKEDDVVTEADLAQRWWRSDEVRSGPEKEKMNVRWRKISMWRDKDDGTNWSNRASWRRIGKAMDWTKGAPRRKEGWRYGVKLNYDSPHRRWWYEWSEAELKQNKRRPISSRSLAFWKMKKNFWKVLNVAAEEKTVHSLSTVVEELCREMGHGTDLLQTVQVC